MTCELNPHTVVVSSLSFLFSDLVFFVVCFTFIYMLSPVVLHYFVLHLSEEFLCFSLFV